MTKAGSLGTARYPAFIDLVKRQLLGRYRDQDLTSEGLRIFTTLDPTVQAAAERNVVSTIKDLESSRGLKTGTLQTA
ncbi:MAG: hypothetical protein L0H19_02825, partial [Salinisphaera sp.]|nr:hypothetical protein [Salinisphaera sp.]